MRRVLYRLPAVLETTANGGTIYITEGEKDADAINEHDPDVASYVATTNPGGAGKWRAEYAETLNGAERVVIWADKDEVGGKHARQVRESLLDLVGSVEIVESRAGKDAADHLAAGHGLEDAVPVGRLRALDLGRLLTEPVEPIPWALPGWMAHRDVVCLAGEPKTGKSWIALDLAIALGRGEKWLGCVEVQGGPYRVLFVDEENNPQLIRYRIRRLAHGLGLGPSDVARLPIRYLSENALNLDDDERLQALFAEVRAFRPDFVVLDSLVRFHRRDENSNQAMAGFFGEVVKPLGARFDAGAVLLHHMAKPSGDRPRGLTYRVRGASDLVAAVDQLWTLERGSGGKLTLTHERSRWAETASPLTVCLKDTTDGEGVLLNAVETDSEAERVILTLLREHAEEGVMRQDLVDAMAAEGIKAADRVTTKHLGRLYHDGRVRKSGSTRQGVRYYLTEHAPQEAA